MRSSRHPQLWDCQPLPACDDTLVRAGARSSKAGFRELEWIPQLERIGRLSDGLPLPLMEGDTCSKCKICRMHHQRYEPRQAMF